MQEEVGNAMTLDRDRGGRLQLNVKVGISACMRKYRKEARAQLHVFPPPQPKVDPVLDDGRAKHTMIVAHLNC